MSKRVFISFEYSGDKEFINGIQGMIANDNIDIDFYNESITTPINSNNSDYVKTKIREKINRASTVLVIVGRDTHSSEWVKWEIETAKKLNKDLIFMRRKFDHSSSMPSSILENKSITDWDIDKLKRL